MLLNSHIILAVLSVVCSSATVFLASRFMIIMSYLIMGTVIITGIALAIIDSKLLTHICISGTLFFIFTIITLKRAHKSLTKNKVLPRLS